MADHQQRIHPIQEPDIEAPQAQSTPLMPRNSSRSDKGDPKYTPQRQQQRQPSIRRTIPVFHSKPPPRRHSCCCKFFCWLFAILIILILAIGVALLVLYLVFQPKLPNYSINSMRVNEFNSSNNGASLYATFTVDITAKNPNKKIGIFYLKGSHITISHDKTQLCEGVLPVFYQGHRNTTMLDLLLTGQTNNATGILTKLQQEQQQMGSIPLDVGVKVPVRVKVGRLKLFRVKFNVKCAVKVDSLSTNNDVKINSSSCKFRLRL